MKTSGSNKTRSGWEMPTWGWFILISYMIIVGFLAPEEWKDWALAGGWFVFGGACMLNYNSCGRVHCKITGPGFLGIGILQIVGPLGLVAVPDWIIWIAFASVMTIGYGLEFRNKKKCGTCYESS